MADFVDPRDVPTDASAPAKEFFDPRDARGTAGELGSAVVRGVGGGIKALGSTIAGGKPGPISSAIKGAGGAVSDLVGPAQPEAHNGATNLTSGIIEGGLSSAPMIGADVIGRAGGAALAPFTGGASEVAGAPALVAAQQYRQTIDEAMDEGRAAGMTGDKLNDYAQKKAAGAAAIWGGASLVPEVAIGAKIAGKAAGIISKAPAAKAALDYVSQSPLGAAAKAVGKGAAVGVPGMTGQAAYNASVDQDAGVSTTTPLEAAKEALPAAIGASVGFSAFHALAAHTDARQAKADAGALADPKNPDRAAAVRRVYDAMVKDDPDGANTWAFNAGEALHAGQPIGIDDSWTAGPHPSVFPEYTKLLSAPNKALPAPDSVASDLGSENGQFPLSVQHGDQNAVDENEARWQARDAAEKARLQASGVLGQAAAVGMDSGAVDHMAEQRAQDVPPGEPPEPPEGGSPQDQQAQANITAWTRSTPGLPLAEAQRRAAAIGADDKPYSVVPHPQGGYAVVPDHLITPALSEQYAGLQSGGQLPKPGTDMPGRMIGRERGTPEPQVYGGTDRATFPFPTPEAAQNRADALTLRTGTEHEVVPHPYAREKFAVQEKAPFTESEQAPGADVQAAVRYDHGQLDIPDHSWQAGHEPEQAGEDKAAGQTPDDRARLQQAGVAPHHVDLFKAPPLEIADRYGGRQATPEEAAGISRVLSKSEGDSGKLHPMFAGTTISVFDKGSNTTLSRRHGVAAYDWRNDAIMVRSDHAAPADAKAAGKTSSYLTHEAGHRLAHNDDGTDKAEEHPAFAIEHTGFDGERQAVGGLVKEALDAFKRGGETLTSQYLDYPLRYWDAHHEDGNLKNRDALTQTIKSELFAQMVSFHADHPDIMRAELPKAFEFIERIQNGIKDSGKFSDTDRAVRETFRTTTAEGSHNGDVAKRAGREAPASDRQRGADTRVGRAVDHERDQSSVKLSVEKDEAKRPALEGLPKSSPGPYEPARAAAASYMKAAGLPYNPPRTFARVDPSYGKRIANAYAAMKHDPSNPEVKAAYQALIKETVAQWHAMMKTGIKIDFADKDHPYPYKVPNDAIRDVRDNNHLAVFSTSEGFGDHLVNIGLDVTGGGHNSKEDVVKALTGAGVRVSDSAVHKSPTGEETVVARLDRPLTPEEAHKVSKELRQESLAQLSGGSGELYGPKADSWKPFDQKLFIGLNGKNVEGMDNPLLEKSGIVHNGKELLANDVFRAVHDFFGHVKEGVSFRHDGEENAWRQHISMYSPEARKAMTSETRGQNSWLNWGPHGEKNRTAKEADTVYAEQKSGVLPPEFVRDMHTDRRDTSGEGEMRAGASAVPGIKKIAEDLLPAERAKLNSGTAQRLVDFTNKLEPTHLEMGAAALAGVAKKGWYREGVKAFVHIFGPDAPRFAALMGALSPRNTVEDNMRQSLAVWRDWLKAGRPTNSGAIFKILDENARSSGPEGTMMNSRVPNAVRALTAEDPRAILLSGPKVASFYKNLIGDVHEVTNDGWMAAYAAIDARLFGGSLGKSGDPGKSVPYLAMSALTRKTAKYLTKLTGEEWTPAEVQETVWSWSKTLYETAAADGEGRSMVQLIKDKAITDALIKSTPDFRTLLHEDAYANLLRQAGYGEKLDALKPGADHGPTSRQGSEAGGKATPAPNEALLRRAAARLDKLREERRTGGNGDAYEDDLPLADERDDGIKFMRDDGRAVPERELEPKLTGNSAEQQFTKSGKPVSETVDKMKPEWISKANAETQSFLAKAGVYAPKKTWREKWAALKQDMGLKILQQTVDQYRPVLAKIGKYPYQLLRMASASDNGLAALVQNGHVEMNKWGALRVKAGTKSFKDIMAPLAGEADRMLGWMAAQRANDLMKEGREHNFTKAEIDAGLKLNGQLHADDKFKGAGTRADAYTKAMKDFSAMNKSVLDVAEHAGLLNAEARAAFEREFYVPFFREEDDGTTEVNPSNVSGMVNQFATKRLKGGENQLHDLMANTMQNWSHLLSASLKNNAAWQTLEHAETLGIATRIKAAEAANGDVYVMQDGKEVHFRVNDKLVYQAISSLGQVPMRGPIMRGLGMMKHALTVGTTWSPIFRLRHTIREQITALAANPTTYNFVKNWIDGLHYSSKNNPEYGNMAAGGAFFHMGLDLDGNRAAYVKRLIAHEIDPKSLVDSEHRALQMLGHMADWWKETGERSDSITRANLYRQTFAKMIAEGKDADQAHFEASYVARDAMDYSLHGINPAIRMITQVVPFMNARMQGLYKLGRGAAEDPKRFAAVVGGVTLATIALSLAQRKDKDIQQASEWDRDNNWLIKVGSVMYRVPKPFEVGGVATLADRALETVLNGFHPSDRERFIDRLGPIIGQQLNLNPIPQAVAPALQLWMNKNWFTGTQIEPGRDEKLSTAMHIGPNTSLPAQIVGKAGVLSPEQIDFLVGAYLGWVGTHVVNTVDLALRATDQFPSKASPRMPDDFFLIGDFAKTLPSDQSRFVSEYYQHMQKIQQAFGDMRMLQQTGQFEQAANLMKSKGDLIGLHSMYLRTQREIGDLNRRQRYVNMSNMTSEEKRTELDRLAQAKNSLAAIAETTRATAVNNR